MPWTGLLAMETVAPPTAALPEVCAQAPVASGKGLGWPPGPWIFWYFMKQNDFQNMQNVVMELPTK